MGNDSWWYNRVGKFATQSNPGSAVPNYGLTMDVATAPWQDQQQFNSLLQSQVTSAVNGIFGAASMIADSAVRKPMTAAPPKATIWDRAKDAGGFVGNQAAGVVGLLGAGADKIGLASDEVDKHHHGGGWKGLQEAGKADLGTYGHELGKDPIASKIFWGLDKVSEGTATAFVAGSVATQKGGADLGLGDYLNGSTWAKAHGLVKSRDMNAGQAFAQMFMDEEILDDDKRYEEMRKHSTVFNASALAFNVIGAWKADPNVIVGKGMGEVRNLRRGVVAKSGDAAAIQRDVIGAGLDGGREAAKAAARDQTGITGRLHAQRAVSLYDRSVAVRQAAKDMNAEDFIRLPMFRRSTSGSIMAQLMREAAGNDNEWNLLFRTSLGDPKALEELRSSRVELADKLNAIESDAMPTAQSELDRVLTRYDARVKEQGRKGADLTLVNDSDWFLHTEATAAQEQVDGLTNRWMQYRTTRDFLDRALRGTEDDRQIGAVFNGLESISVKGGRGGVAPLGALSAKVNTWQHDAFSPIVRTIKMPRFTALRRIGGAVDLHDVEAGVSSVMASLDQLDHIVGRSSSGFRDKFVADYAASTTDVSRRNMLASLHHGAFSAIAKKYGIDDPAMMKEFTNTVLEKRNQGWVRLSDQARWRKLAHAEGEANAFPFMDEAGGLNFLHADQSLDVSQLQNHFPMVNWTDLDHTIRMNADIFKEMNGLRKAGLWSGRKAEEFYETLGSTFNSFWKPLALISLRWPLRVLGDEGYRIQHMTGTLNYLMSAQRALDEAVFNKGIVKPIEMWQGRKVRTGPSGAEPTRAGYDPVDPMDARGETNPTSAMTVDSLDHGDINPARYDQLREMVDARRGELANTHVTQGNPPAWMKQFNDRLAAAETAESRGFFFDPVSHRARNKGFAVSTYPGRLRTFEGKPSAHALNAWMDDNASLLAIPGNRVAVWNDKDTGRWHLDVVKHHARREDAMVTAAKSNANEFFDVSQGFTRYMSDEDPFQHYSSPFVVPDVADDTVAGGVVPGMPEASPARVPARRKTGVGTRTFRGPDDQQFTIPAVYGMNPEDLNIWSSANSSKDMAQALYGGYTKGMEVRRQAAAGGHRTFHPGEEGSPEAEDWSKAWAFFVNRHVRNSPVWLRMLNGESDEAIARWLQSSEGRAKVGERLGHPVGNPIRYVQEKRAQFDNLIPNEQTRLAASKGDVRPAQADELVPHEQRGTISAAEVALLNGGQKGWYGLISKVYEKLGSLPNDTFVRHPFASLMYDTRMKNYLSSLPDGTVVTQATLNAAQAEARAFANKQIKKYLYNIADENNATHMLRFLAPFAQAQYEVLDRYLRIFAERPEALARTLQLYVGSQQSNGIWETVDKDGNPTKRFSHDNKVVFQVTPAMRHMARNIPGLNKVLNAGVGSLAIPVSSLDLILQGDSPILPSVGPLVTIPANEFYFQKHPFSSENDLYKWMFPFGTPKGGNPLARSAQGMLPAYVRRMWTAFTSDFDDSAFAGRVSFRYQDLVTQWQKEHNGAPFPARLEKRFTDQAVSDAKAEYFLRAATSFLSPVPIEARSPHQFWIDRARDYRMKYGMDADQKFYDDFGADYFRYFQEVTKSTNGLAPTAAAARGYAKNKALVDQAPDLAGVIAGPFASTGEFNSEVYQWQLRTRKGPGSRDTMREILDPEERITAGQEAQGWIEYGKLSSALDAELKRRAAAGGSASLNANANADLASIKDSKVEEIVKRNPGWESAYNSRQDKLSNWLTQAYGVAFDKRLDGRTDIEGLRAYLKSRQILRQELEARQAQYGTSDTLPTRDPVTGEWGESDNTDLAMAWESYVQELTGKNLLFSEVYHRYLENDDLTALRG